MYQVQESLIITQMDIIFKICATNHLLIAKKFEKQVNNSLRGNVRRQLVQRKGQMCLRLQFQIICSEKYLQKGLCATTKFLKKKTLVF